MQLREGEVFVSRIFDESGWQLVQLFDANDPAFRFVLDESVSMPDVLMPVDEQLLVGWRSGFAFYDDVEMNRKVLVGVDYKNITVNNYYDGPFDQLADNFVKDDTFRKYAERVFPSIEGKINNRGVFLDEEGNAKSSRLSLQPHVKYYSVMQLKNLVNGCRDLSEAVTIACLTKDDKQRDNGTEE